MKIKKVTNQIRRDFWCIYECEHCGAEVNGSGYDDANFHHVVIPAKICQKCGKIAGDDYRPLATKHPDHATI